MNVLDKGVELLARGYPLSPISRGLEAVLTFGAKHSKGFARLVDTEREGPRVASLLFDMASIAGFGALTALGMEYAHAHHAKPWVDYAIMIGGAYPIVTGLGHVLARSRAFGEEASWAERLVGSGVAAALVGFAVKAYHAVLPYAHELFTKTPPQ